MTRGELIDVAVTALERAAVQDGWTPTPETIGLWRQVCAAMLDSGWLTVSVALDDPGAAAHLRTMAEMLGGGDRTSLTRAQLQDRL